MCVTQLVLSSTWSTNNLQADPVSPESDLRVGDKQFTDVFRHVSHFLSSKHLFLRLELLLDVPVGTAAICVLKHLKHTITEAEDDE